MDQVVGRWRRGALRDWWDRLAVNCREQRAARHRELAALYHVERRRLKRGLAHLALNATRRRHSREVRKRRCTAVLLWRWSSWWRWWWWCGGAVVGCANGAWSSCRHVRRSRRPTTVICALPGARPTNCLTGGEACCRYVWPCGGGGRVCARGSYDAGCGQLHVPRVTDDAPSTTSSCGPVLWCKPSSFSTSESRFWAWGWCRRSGHV